MLHRLVKKFALFTVKILYQNQQHGNGSLAFVLEIDVKDELRSSRPITEKSDEIMVKVERDKHVSTVEFARHRPQNSFKSFIQSWIQKEARCLGSSRIEC